LFPELAMQDGKPTRFRADFHPFRSSTADAPHVIDSLAKRAAVFKHGFGSRLQRRSIE